MITPASINQKLVIPQTDSTTPVKEEEAKTIYDLLKSRGITKTLEIGFAYARSASHIMAATNSGHIAIDPFQDHYQNLGIKNIESLGFAGKLELIRDYSHSVLPMFVKENRKFEFIFIDGDHKFDGIFIDFYYSDFLIDKGGLLLFHDTWMRSTELVLQFIRTNRKDYKELPVANQNMALFTKVGDDQRDGMHFREFYNTKSLLRHHLTMHMYEKPNGMVRKSWLTMKSLLSRRK